MLIESIAFRLTCMFNSFQNVSTRFLLLVWIFIILCPSTTRNKSQIMMSCQWCCQIQKMTTLMKVTMKMAISSMFMKRWQLKLKRQLSPIAQQVSHTCILYYVTELDKTRLLHTFNPLTVT